MHKIRTKAHRKICTFFLLHIFIPSALADHNSIRFIEDYSGVDKVLCGFRSESKILTVLTNGTGGNPEIIAKDKNSKSIRFNRIYSSYNPNNYTYVNRYYIEESPASFYINSKNMRLCASD